MAEPCSKMNCNSSKAAPATIFLPTFGIPSLQRYDRQRSASAHDAHRERGGRPCPLTGFRHTLGSIVHLLCCEDKTGHTDAHDVKVQRRIRGYGKWLRRAPNYGSVGVVSSTPGLRGPRHRNEV
jgi:hypothetical protein